MGLERSQLLLLRIVSEIKFTVLIGIIFDNLVGGQEAMVISMLNIVANSLTIHFLVLDWEWLEIMDVFGRDMRWQSKRRR